MKILLDMRSHYCARQRVVRLLFELALLGACAPTSDRSARGELAARPAPDEVGEQASELLCGGPGCTCGPTFGIGFVQGTLGFGVDKNFELVVPHAGGGFSHYYRDNLAIVYPYMSTWHGPFAFGSGDVAGVALIESNLGDGNLELVATVGGQLVAYYRARNTLPWIGPTLIASGVTGQPALVQNRNQSPGNFEVVVPLQGGGLKHFWRNNSALGTPWTATPGEFATGRVYSAVTMIQSTLGGGNLEVIARSGSQLWATFRNASGWQPATLISAAGAEINATGIPSFVQSQSGNFELVVPTPAGLAHYWRDNGALGYPWRAPTIIDSVTTAYTYSSAAVIQSSYGFGTNLEVVARRSNGVLAAFRRSGLSWEWKAAQGGVSWAGQVFGAEPCCDAAAKGKWSDPIYTALDDAGTIPMHAALLRNGNVLFLGFDNIANGFSQVLDPSTGVVSLTQPDGERPHVFCSGHTFLPDGRMWIAGGHHETRDHMHVFDPATNGFTQLAPLPQARWYPSVARLANGKALVISGATNLGRLSNVSTPPNLVNNTWQLFDPTSNTLSAPFDVPPVFSADGRKIELYPFVFALPDGRVAVHSRHTTRFLDPTTAAWEPRQLTTNYPHSRIYPGYGTAILQMLSPSDSYRARLLLIGGSGDIAADDLDVREEDTNGDATVVATNTVEQLDLGAASPAWQNRAPMSFRRVMNTAILLPNGTVFSVGGGTIGRANLGHDPVMVPEIYDPAANTWTQMCTMRVPRLYHGVALLLPDARVLTAGRDHLFNVAPHNWPERRIEIFSPPYLNSGNPRPVINTVPSANLGYNAVFSVTVNAGAVPPANITRAVLMAPGAVTHGFDMNQHAVELTIVSRTATSLSLRTPPNAAIAPPGDYMLFLLSNAGVPSVAKFVTVR